MHEALAPSLTLRMGPMHKTAGIGNHLLAERCLRSTVTLVRFKVLLLPVPMLQAKSDESQLTMSYTGAFWAQCWKAELKAYTVDTVPVVYIW